MQNIRAICFDLDNTLWDLGPVIPRAERALYAWYAEHYPRVTEIFSLADMLALRQAMISAMPDYVHDLTALRMAALRRIAAEAGYPEEMAEQAFGVFQKERNAVTLYEDVVPVLESLTASHSLFALTNGNADLEVIGIAHLFRSVFTARQLGMAKPDVGVYAAVCREAGYEPHEMLHVGDDPANDIVAAAEAGWRTVWVNRKGDAWQHQESNPDDIVTDLYQLTKLFDRG